MDVKEIIPKIKNYFRQQGNIDLVRDPFHDWHRLFIIFIIVTGIVLVIEGFVFYRVSKGTLFRPNSSETVQSSTVPTTVLKKISDQYQAKEDGIDEALGWSVLQAAVPASASTSTTTITATTTTVVQPVQ